MSKSVEFVRWVGAGSPGELWAEAEREAERFGATVVDQAGYAELSGPSRWASEFIFEVDAP